jgi:hypothetical protein
MLFIQVFNTLLWTESCQVSTLHPQSPTSPVIRRKTRPRDILTTWYSVFSTAAWWHNSSYLSLLYHGASPSSARFCIVTLVPSQARPLVLFYFLIIIYTNGNNQDVSSDISVKLTVCKSDLFLVTNFFFAAFSHSTVITVSSKYCLYS